MQQEWVAWKRQEMADHPLTFKSGVEVVEQGVDRQIVRWFGLEDPERRSYLYLPTPPALCFVGAIAPQFLLQFVMRMHEHEPDVPVQIEIAPIDDNFDHIDLNAINLDAYTLREESDEVRARFYDAAVRAFLELLGPDADEAS